MSSTVTVLGASGTIQVPFVSKQNATFAKTLAGFISSQITAGAIYPDTYNDPAPPALPTTPGGATIGEFVLGQNLPASTTITSLTLPSDYPVLVDNATTSVTVTASPSPAAAFSVLGGTGGLAFYAGSSSVGGSIFLGGGLNTIAGSSAGGGLNGNWRIGTGGAPGTDKSTIYLGSGNDVVTSGDADTIYGGSGNFVGFVSAVDADTTGSTSHPTIFLGNGSYTLVGQGSSFYNVDNSSTSGGVSAGGSAGGGDFFGGLGGNQSIEAGIGNTTLISGGGGGDTLTANSTSGAQAVLFGSGASDVLLASSTEGSSGGSTLYGGAGAGESLLGGSGNDALAVGAGGNTTLTSGSGNDTFWFDQGLTKGTNQTDYVSGFTSNDTLILDGYGGASGYQTVTASAGASLTLKLSDGTLVNFVNSSGITSPSNLKITTIG